MRTQHLLRHIPAQSLHVSTPTWWLESRFHFSFADYYNPRNLNFGKLRVLNDDLVKGHSGFGRHPHRDAEIFSYIVQGELTHADSLGNKESLGRGCLQYLSAGTGITHAEMNDGGQTCRFLQVWITPDKSGHTPQYGSTKFELKDRHNVLLHVLGGTGEVPQWQDIACKAGDGGYSNTIRLHQDTNVFVSESDAGKAFQISLEPNRQAYLVCIEGSLGVEADGTGDERIELAERDAAELGPVLRVSDNKRSEYIKLTTGEQGAHFLLIEMKV